MVETVCDDCGETIQENHMGQSLHRCDYKKRSGEVAERLEELLIENVDYYLIHDTTVELTLHGDYEPKRMMFRAEPDGPAHVLSPSLEYGRTERRHYDGMEYGFELSVGEKEPFIDFSTGYRGRAQIHGSNYEGGSAYLTEIEVETHV